VASTILVHLTFAIPVIADGRENGFSLVAGAIFAVVALFHLVRIFAEWNLIIGDWSVPKSVSWIALIVAGVLALFAFRFAANNDH
jgi:hypothetical protein